MLDIGEQGTGVERRAATLVPRTDTNHSAMTKILGIVAIVAGAAIGAGLSIVALVFTAVGGSGGHIAPLTILFGLVLLASYGYGVRRAWTNFQQGDLFGAGGALLMPPILAYLIMLVGLLAVLMFKTIFS